MAGIVFFLVRLTQAADTPLDPSGYGLDEFVFSDLADYPAPALQPGIVKEIEGGYRIDNFTDWDVWNKASPFGANFTAEIYDDSSVFLSSINPQGDTVSDLVPEIFFQSAEKRTEAKNFLRLSYDPQILRFSTFSALDRVNQRGSLQYGYRGGKWNLFASHRSAEVSGTNFSPESLDPGAEDETLDSQQFSEFDRDVVNRTQFTYHKSFVNIDTEIGARTELLTKLVRRKVEFEGNTGSDTDIQTIENSLKYDFSPKLDIGLRHRLGWIHYSDFPDQEFQQIEFYENYLIRPEWTLDFSIGMENRSFDAAGVSNSSKLRYQIELEWEPSPRTTFSINTYKNTRTSVLGDLVDAEGLRAQLKQDIGSRLHFQLSWGMESAMSDRVNANLAGIDGRYEFVNSSLDYEVGRRIVIGVFHRYRSNQSNLSRGFTRSQAGVRIRAEY